MRTKRAAIAGIMMTIMMILMMGRLAWLQLMPSAWWTASAGKPPVREGWKRMAVVQRQRSLVLDSGRGDFVDRHGLPITGETYKTLALFPVRADRRGSAEQLRGLAELLGVSEPELRSRWDAMEAPDFWRTSQGQPPVRLTSEQAMRIEALGVEGISVLPYRNRYPDAFDAKHWIGFTSEHPEWLAEHHADELASGRRKLSEQVGGSGLEKSLDSLLHGVGETSVSYFMDGRRGPLHGLSTRIVQPRNGYYPLAAVTTVDLRLQNKLEAYADRMGLQEGAIVVLDAHNADIVAMVSRPKLHPGQFATADGSEWTNHALKAVEPGSIYKLVTAAAALEYDAVRRDERFLCTGEYGKYGLSCWKRGGHGLITLKEGLAHSCNIVFATLAERLKAEQLAATAAALGASGRVGWHSDKPFGPFAGPVRLLEEEEAGRLFAGSAAAADGGVLAQSGIGQRDVRLSPLGAANMIVTLLRGGQVMEPRIVSEIRYASGERMAKLAPRRAAAEGRRISPATAQALLRGMEAVVASGTGASIRDGAWTVAGKSGTAETSGARIHQWFAGYGPVQSPRYAVAVLAANRLQGSPHQATQLFRGVMDIAADFE